MHAFSKVLGLAIVAALAMMALVLSRSNANFAPFEGEEIKGHDDELEVLVNALRALLGEQQAIAENPVARRSQSLRKEPTTPNARRKGWQPSSHTRALPE
jgi:hypothetical protein